MNFFLKVVSALVPLHCNFFSFRIFPIDVTDASIGGRTFGSVLHVTVKRSSPLREKGRPGKTNITRIANHGWNDAELVDRRERDRRWDVNRRPTPVFQSLLGVCMCVDVRFLFLWVRPVRSSKMSTRSQLTKDLNGQYCLDVRTSCFCFSFLFLGVSVSS